MYSIWTKLTSIEDILLGTPDEVVDYFRTNFSSPVQQIRSMFSERAESIKKNSLEEITNNSLSCRILHEKDPPFDSTCDYIGFIVHSYHGKSEFELNGQRYKRGDILIKDIHSIPNSVLILRSGLYNQNVYKKLYEFLFKWHFNTPLDKNFVGLGIHYHQDKWKFDAFIFHSNPTRSLFSLDEHNLLEMYVLTWTQNMNDKISIRNSAQKMLNDQLSYIKDLLETQRSDIESIWVPEEIDLAIKAFEYEIKDEIAQLFQTAPIFNTFTNLRNQIQSKNDSKLDQIVEIFEHRRLTIKTQPSEPLLCHVWKQLQTVENWLHTDDFNPLVNFLHMNSFSSVESLFSIPIPPFLDQLGICPESDPFDPTLNYIGLLIYLYNDQDEFTLNKHPCKCGQILIRNEENITDFAQEIFYKQTSFTPLFIHEYLYESYFNEKPKESFQGIGFVYEQGKWKFDVITYAGLHGIHSTFDIRGDNPMALNMNEQHSIDLVLSTVYMNNRWQEELGCMYTIAELESIGRSSFEKEIEIIEELFQTKKTNLTTFNDTCHLTLKNFIEQYRPKPSLKSVILKNDKIRKRLSTRTSRKTDKDVQPPTHPESNGGSKTELEPNSPADNLFNNSPLQTPSTPSISPKHKKPPGAFFTKPFSRRGSKPRDSSSTFHTDVKSSNSIDRSEEPPSNYRQTHRTMSVSSKTKEPITLFQLWRELCDAEQKILHHTNLDEFIKYIKTKDYINYSESIHLTPPDDRAAEYYLMAEIKIDAQLEYVNKLFLLKKLKLLQQQSDQDKKQIDDLFKTFGEHYTNQIRIAKKHFKSKF